jgi:hypothetical protein
VGERQGAMRPALSKSTVRHSDWYALTKSPRSGVTRIRVAWAKSSFYRDGANLDPRLPTPSVSRKLQPQLQTVGSAVPRRRLGR